MNGHKVQSLLANAEVDTLMKASSHIVTPQRNSPIAGIVQDGLIASYKITNVWNDGTETSVDRDIVMDCLTTADVSISHYQKILHNAQRWYSSFIVFDGVSYGLKGKQIPGKLLASFLFPSNFEYKSKDDDNVKGVRIKMGCMLPKSGPLCKKTMGSKHGSILHILWKVHSPERAMKFLTQSQKLTDVYMGLCGFSMGLADCVLNDDKPIKELLQKLRGNVSNLIEQDNKDQFLQEAKINAELNSAMNEGTKLVIKHMNKGDKNGVEIMRSSGAKGSYVNLTHKMGFIGQQNIQGKRIPCSVGDGTRTLPIFKKGDNSAAARGFIFNNYTHGLKPSEMYHHAEAGRDGIVAISCRTAESGYAHKCMSRKMDDCVVGVDGTVRNASGNIVQFLYGDMGISPKNMWFVDKLKFPFFVNPQDIANKVNAFGGTNKRCLSSHELDEVCLYVRAGYPAIVTPVTNMATSCLRQALKLSMDSVTVYEELIPRFTAEIIHALEMSKIQCGDSVGLIAASSIGEPTTQLSIPGYESILIKQGTKIHKTKIGELVEFLLPKPNPKIKHSNSDIFMSIFGECEYEVASLDKNEKVVWKPIKGVVKHLSTQDMIKITTKSGRKCSSTASHSHVSKKNGEIEFVNASSLKKGDRIPVIRNLTIEAEYYNLDGVILNFDFGWFVGICVLGGLENINSINAEVIPKFEIFKKIYQNITHFISREFCKKMGEQTRLLDFYYNCNDAFKKGILCGFFDARGTLQCSENRLYIDFCKKEEPLMQDIVLLLQSLGIFSVFDGQFCIYSKDLQRKYAVYSTRF